MVGQFTDFHCRPVQMRSQVVESGRQGEAASSLLEPISLELQRVAVLGNNTNMGGCTDGNPANLGGFLIRVVNQLRKEHRQAGG